VLFHTIVRHVFDMCIEQDLVAQKLVKFLTVWQTNFVLCGMFSIRYCIILYITQILITVLQKVIINISCTNINMLYTREDSG
jgi:hypothetical protein